MAFTKNMAAITLSTAVATLLAMSGCGSSSSGGGNTSSSSSVSSTSSSSVSSTSSSSVSSTSSSSSSSASAYEPLSNNITTDTRLTADKVYLLDGKTVVSNGATLTIDKGTTIVGTYQTGATATGLIVDKGSKIIAEGTDAEPIKFVGQIAYEGGADEQGQWGGITLIGNAGQTGKTTEYEVFPEFVPGYGIDDDNSGTLTYVEIHNSGIAVDVDKELQGLSMVGVGNGTTIDHITVDMSDDDGIEIWGGTVNLSNVAITNCTDDYLDMDEGYVGTVDGLTIVQETLGYSAIEMSGTSLPTVKNFSITQNASVKEGTVFFKKDGIGIHMINGTITDNTTDTYGAIYSRGANNVDGTMFEHVMINGTSTDARFTGKEGDNSIDAIQEKFEGGLATLTVKSYAATQTIANNITADLTLDADTLWVLDGKTVVSNGAVLTINKGATIVGTYQTGATATGLIIDKDSQIYVEGTAAEPVVFMGQENYNTGNNVQGQWGGITIIGNAGQTGKTTEYEVFPEFVPGYGDDTDSSGSLEYIKIFNSGIAVDVDKELQGLSMVGVGSGTVIDHIAVSMSDDDGIEIWGGTVNLSYVQITDCTDDYLDMDEGYVGTVDELMIVQDTLGYSAIEMSGTSLPTVTNFSITQNASVKEGTVFFKKDGIGIIMTNGTIMDNYTDGYGAIYSRGANNVTDTVFTDVTIGGTSTDVRFTGKEGDNSIADLQTKIEAGSGVVVE